MKRFPLYLFIISYVLFSCNSGTIPLNDLSHIIADMYLADATAVSNYSIIKKADSVAIYESVINKHGYTAKEFHSTIDKLIERPGKLRMVYEKAKEELVEKQKIANSEITILPENSASPEIMSIIYEIDQGKEINRYKRTLRWITYPFDFVHWKVTFSKAEQAKFEDPRLPQWWVNTLTGKDKPIYKNENNRGSNFIPNQL